MTGWFTRRLSLLILLVVSFGTILAACGDNTVTPGLSTSAPAAATTSGAATTAPGGPATTAAGPASTTAGGAVTTAAGATTAAAKSTGTLTILGTPQEDWVQLMAQTFEKKTGIKTNYIRLSSGEGYARLKAEKANPSFSIWWGGPADTFIDAKGQGLLEQYKSPAADKIPAQYKDTDSYWTGIYVGSLGFASNKELLAKKGLKAPTSWEDLLKPEFKGQIAVAHPASSGTSYTMVSTLLQLKGEDAGWEYLKKLHPQIFQYSKVGAAPGEMAGRGEVTVGIIFSHDTVKYIKQGFPLELSFPQEGTGYEIGGMAIIKGAKEPVEAKMFYDWALSKEAQELGPQVLSFQLPTNPDAKVDPNSIPLDKVKTINYDFVASGEKRSARLKKFQDEIAPAPK